MDLCIWRLGWTIGGKLFTTVATRRNDIFLDCPISHDWENFTSSYTNRSMQFPFMFHYYWRLCIAVTPAWWSIFVPELASILILWSLLHFLAILSLLTFFPFSGPCCQYSTLNVTSVNDVSYWAHIYMWSVYKLNLWG